MDMLRHLRFFVTVAEERHVGRAAARLVMAQPPVSQGVQRLERSLGVRLFERGPRGMALSEHGRQLLPRARALLEDEDALRRAATRLAEAAARLRVGVAPEVGVRRTAALAAALGAAVATHHPDRGDGQARPPVVVTTGPSLHLVDAAVAGAHDVVVVTHPCVLEGLSAGAVATLPTDLLLPTRHPGAEGAPDAPVDVTALRDLRPVLAPRRHGPAAFDVLLDRLREHGCTAEPIEADDEATAAALVASGQGFRLSADADIAVPGVVRRPLAGEPLPVRLRVAWAGSAPAPAVRRALESALAATPVPGAGRA